ncbi:helix-turn-helix domain-containing protein [Metabacillus mangrovi]|uniref:helix-turn-helix domain-containing protein n=1 Tax=Metabacillus mangrovi TaxID=1491830 RepID=UPI0012BB08B4|nr:RodZ domain-containing protein [Metabacillus mangrovi]
MSELGNRLKQAREEKQLTLDDLQSLTKIQKRYLIGIEEGNYKIMPGKFYVRAFIKQYAEAVGLDPDELFEQYRSDVPDNGHDEELPGQLSRVQSQRELPETASKAIDLLPKLIVIVLIIAAAVVLWIIGQNFTGAEKPKTSQPEAESIGSEVKMDDSLKETENDKEEEKPAQDPPAEKAEPPKEEKPAVSVSGKATGSGTSEYTVTGADQLQIELTGKGSAWISVTSGKQSLYTGTLKKGTTEKVNAGSLKEARIRIGNTTNTDIKVNGQPLKYVIQPSERMTQTITLTKSEKPSS